LKEGIPVIGALIVDIVVISPQLGHILQVFPRQGDEFWLRRFGTEEEALQYAQNFSTINGVQEEIESAIRARTYHVISNVFCSAEDLSRIGLHRFLRQP
jgi:hypothetical protein